VLQAGSQVGFQILDPESYTNAKQFGSSVQQYDLVYLDDVSFAAAAQVCMNASAGITLDGLSAPSRAQTTIQSEGTVNVTGDIRGSNQALFCITAANGVTLTAGAAEVTLAAPNPISAGATILLGVITAGAALGCALGY
jgi:hypothetical protein